MLNSEKQSLTAPTPKGGDAAAPLTARLDEAAKWATDGAVFADFREWEQHAALLADASAALLAARRERDALRDAMDATVKQWDAVLPQAEWHEVKAMVPVILAARQLLRAALAATPEEK